MITKEDLRKIMEAEGYTQEEMEEVAAMHFPGVDLRDALDEWLAYLERIAGNFERLANELLELGTLPPLPKKAPPRPPRPPRYAGPQNKGRAWTRPPSRQARSDCRKRRPTW